MELMIPLDTRSGVPMYEQVYSYMKEEIRKGNLRTATGLPSTRVLAENLKANRSTTQMAYKQLVSEGYIETVPCKGYYVTRVEELVEAKQAAGEDFRAGLEAMPHECYQMDFSSRGIGLNHFPYNARRKVTRSTLVDDNEELFLTGNPQGEAASWEAIRGYLHSARGVNCSQEQIIVGVGNECLPMLLPRILRTEHVIAMESPAYKQAYLVLDSLGCPVIPVEMDRYGFSAKLLEENGADIIYVTPSHQYPTGIVIPVKRRQELLDRAGKSPPRYLIEDDYDSKFHYKSKPIPAPQGMDSAGGVIYIGTFPRFITPTTRVSYMAPPAPPMENYQKKTGLYASTVFRADQNILYQFPVGGYYECHLSRMRAIRKVEHDTLMAAPKGLEAEFSVKGEYAGPHVLLTHKKGRPESWLMERVKESGVRMYGLSPYLIHPQHNVYPSVVILGYANLGMEEIERGIALLKDTQGEESGNNTVE